MADEIFGAGGRGEAEALAETTDRVDQRVRDLERTAHSFSRAMTSAFARSVTGARSFDDVLKSLYLRLSDMALRAAFRPLEQGIASGFSNLLSGLFGGASGSGGRAAAVLPFATGGVIGTPSYFPMPQGGLGLAGEAGPEAILPLARGSDGRLGIRAGGSGGAVHVTMNISTPDVAGFRRSQSQVAAEMNRAIQRGRRNL